MGFVHPSCMGYGYSVSALWTFSNVSIPNAVIVSYTLVNVN